MVMYNVCCMIRKQLYLTAEIERELVITARRLGKPTAEVVRDILGKGLKVERKNEPAGTVLLKMANNAFKRGPKDLSRNLTSYLYGEKSPNYGKGKKSTDLTKAEAKRLNNFLYGKSK